MNLTNEQWERIAPLIPPPPKGGQGGKGRPSTPLRDRLEDIPLLVNFYIDRISRRLGKVIRVIPAGVMDALQQYHWPGNVRELENVLERAVINSSGSKLRLVDDLKKSRMDTSRLEQTLEHVERDYIKRVLEQAGWKVSGKNSASEILGLDRSTLRAHAQTQHPQAISSHIAILNPHHNGDTLHFGP